jgi:RNA polymerase sigma-70 factor (ECF subfamily)
MMEAAIALKPIVTRIRTDNRVEQDEIKPEVLISRSQEGCRDSFEQLVRYYEKRVFNYLCQFVGNSHDAEDLTQDTFVKVYKNIHRYKPQYAFTTWLFTIAKRTALNFFRAKRSTSELDENLKASGPNPSELVENRDSARNFWAMTENLKPKQREALWLRYGQGMSISEIATIMGTNDVFIRVTLHRARGVLAKKLQHKAELI